MTVYSNDKSNASPKECKSIHSSHSTMSLQPIIGLFSLPFPTKAPEEQNHSISNPSITTTVSLDLTLELVNKKWKIKIGTRQ